ncbi:MAG: hypothetical protein WCF90_08275 [Methanomicrobiales archaeon]
MFAERFDVVFCGEGDLTFTRFCHDYLATGSNPGILAPPRSRFLPRIVP